jgi:hypothetical protein
MATLPNEFRIPTPAPAKVHDRARALLGHYPCWIHRKVPVGGCSVAHFRTCSYCLCIHPGDMIDLLLAGSSALEETGKPGKLCFVTPNPIRGELVRIGSHSGPIFAGEVVYFPPARRLAADPRRDLSFEPTTAERLAGHYEQPVYEVAPDLIRWAFYAEHTNERQMAEIAVAAAKPGGKTNALSSS